MSWILLILAALLEVVWAIGLKYTHGFTKLWPSLWTALAMVGSIVLLAWAARSLPIGTAYAVWTGIGAAGTAVLGVYLFGEPASAARVAGLALIVLGVILLKMSG
jgi:quaternary ammonium compound-resistance protein SugE